MGAALEMGRALGIEQMAVAELLPVIESVMIRKTNEQINKGGGNG